MNLQEIVFLREPDTHAQLMLLTLQPFIIGQIWQYKNDALFDGELYNLAHQDNKEHAPYWAQVPGYRIIIKYKGTLDRRLVARELIVATINNMVQQYLKYIEKNPARVVRYKLPEDIF